MTTDSPSRPMIPLDEAGLYEYVRATKYTERYLIADRLQAQEGGNIERFHNMVDHVLETVAHGENILATREKLREALTAAVQAVNDAARVHAELAGPLYDVEYAEGGDLLDHYLTEASRAIRTAAQVNPCRDEK